MSGSLIQRARVLEATLRDRIAQDERWFAERHTELRQMREIALLNGAGVKGGVT